MQLQKVCTYFLQVNVAHPLFSVLQLNTFLCQCEQFEATLDYNRILWVTQIDSSFLKMDLPNNCIPPGTNQNTH